MFASNQKFLLSKNLGLKPNPPSLPAPYFRLSAGENLLLDKKLGVRRWVDSIRNLFFSNHYLEYIPFAFSVYGFYPVFDSPLTKTALKINFNSQLNSQEFTAIFLMNFTGKVVGSSFQYTPPIWNRVATLQNGTYFFTGWNVYAINSGLGKNDYKWEFWTGAGDLYTGWNIVKGNNVTANKWTILGCRRGFGKTSIFEDGKKINETTVPYVPNTSGVFYIMPNEILDLPYFNYALEDKDILNWSNYLKKTYALYF